MKTTVVVATLILVLLIQTLPRQAMAEPLKALGAAVLTQPEAQQRDLSEGGAANSDSRIRSASESANTHQVLLAAAPGPTDNQERIRVDSFRIVGNTAFSEAKLQKVVEASRDRDLTLKELRKVADSLADYYHRKGYFLAKVVVPEQEIAGGVVTLQVLEGKLEDLLITGNKHYRTSYLRHSFQELRNQKAIRKQDLEKAILLLNDDPGIKVTSVLQPGSEQGTTDIAINVEEKDDIQAALEFNNFGNQFSSRERLIPSLSVPNLSGRGDPLSLRVVSGFNTERLFYGQIAYTSAPIEPEGTRINLYINDGNFDIGQRFALLNVTGSGTSIGVSATRPIHKTRTNSLTGEFGFDAKDTDQDLFGFISSRDRVRLLRLGVNYSKVGKRNRDMASLYVHRGLGDRFGGMNDNDKLSSRFGSGADDRFTKLVASVGRVQYLNPRTFLIERLSGQWASDSLVVGEQFSIGGPDSVRGYPQAEFLGDSGIQGSLEARYSFIPAKPSEWQGAFFVDYGAITVKNPVPGQTGTTHLTGVGFGVRSELPKWDLSLRADLGFAVGGRPSEGGRAKPYLQVLKKF